MPLHHFIEQGTCAFPPLHVLAVAAEALARGEPWGGGRQKPWTEARLGVAGDPDADFGGELRIVRESQRAVRKLNLLEKSFSNNTPK
jgi:hypothetical protein